MSGFEAMPHDTYPLIYEMTRRAYDKQEWPVELVILHLRWLVGERILRRMKPRAFPTVRQLAEEFGWKSVDRTARFIADVDRWQDPYQRMSLDELRGDRAFGVNRRCSEVTDGGQTTHGRQQDGERTARAEQRREPARRADDRRTPSGREADGAQTPCASLPRASTLHPVHPSPSGEGDACEVLVGRPPVLGLAPVFVNGLPLPPDLPALFATKASVGNRGVVQWLLSIGVESTSALLRLPADRWRLVGLKDAAVAAAVVEHLRHHWKVEPGALADLAPKGAVRGEQVRPDARRESLSALDIAIENASRSGNAK